MKKLILPIIAVLLLSCSKSDDQPAPQPAPITSYLKTTINGTTYTFNKFVVEPQFVTDPGGNYTDLHVIAYIIGDDSHSIEFNCEQDAAGPESIYYFYAFSGGDYDHDLGQGPSVFNTNLTTNSNKRLIGTFSGTLDNADDTQMIELTNGSFDISY